MDQDVEKEEEEEEGEEEVVDEEGEEMDQDVEEEEEEEEEGEEEEEEEEVEEEEEEAGGDELSEGEVHLLYRLSDVAASPASQQIKAIQGIDLVYLKALKYSIVTNCLRSKLLRKSNDKYARNFVAFCSKYGQFLNTFVGKSSNMKMKKVLLHLVQKKGNFIFLLCVWLNFQFSSIEEDSETEDGSKAKTLKIIGIGPDGENLYDKQTFKNKYI